MAVAKNVTLADAAYGLQGALRPHCPAPQEGPRDPREVALKADRGYLTVCPKERPVHSRDDQDVLVS